MRKILALLFFCLCTIVGYGQNYIQTKDTTENEILTFTHLGGVYEEAFELNIFTSGVSTIRYTTDGTAPTKTSRLYDSPIELDRSYHSQANINQIENYAPGVHELPNPNAVQKCIVIRAAAFNEAGECVSKVVTHSYFIKKLGIDHAALPIISICAEHSDLFDEQTGIFVPGVHWDADDPLWTGNYYQRGRDWEKSIHIEFYANSNNIGFRQDAGLRTHGGNGRRHPQKGLRLYARSEYGSSHFNYPVFEERPITAYKRLVLKSFASSWSQAGVEDYLTSKIAQGLNLDAVAMRPAILYINGEYWGFYYLQERTDERYLEANFEVDKDSVDLIEDWWGGTVAGNSYDFLMLYNYFVNNDFSTNENYDIISEWLDIDNFIDYQLFQIFIANKDWPVNNMKCWKPQNDGKWRWIFYDGDAGLEDLEYKGYDKALSTEEEGGMAHATLFLRKLLENPTFNNKFFKRLEELLNTHLNYQNTEPLYQDIIPLVGNEIHRQISRFSVPADYEVWSEKLTNLQQFLALRACEMEEQTIERFDVSAYPNICNLKKPDVRDVLVFPNPNNGNFTLTLDSSTATAANVIIINSLGQIFQARNMVLEKGNNTILFNDNRLPNSVLSVNIFMEDSVFTIPIICIKK